MEEKFVIQTKTAQSGYQTQKHFYTYNEIFDQGYAALQHNDVVTAEQRFQFLYDQNDEDPLVLFFCAGTALKKKQLNLAKMLLKETVKVNRSLPKDDPRRLKKENLASTYNNLGYVYTHQQKKKEAEEWFKKAIKLNPQGFDLYSNIGSLYVNEGNPEKGIEFLDKSLELKPDHPFATWNKGLCLLELGQYGEGFDAYESGFLTQDRVDRNYNNGKVPFWDGKSKGTIVVYGEQGIGDEIMFASILPDLIKDNDVIFECHPRMTDIFRRSFDIPVYGTRKANQITWPSFHKIDYKVSIATLGKYYRRKPEDFPKKDGYLKADPDLIKLYKQKLDELGDKPKIGVHWKGGIPKTNQFERTIPLDQWTELFGRDATFISLQYTPDADKEAAEYGLVHWQDAIDDYDHTAALVSNLDLVISVCTSVIHLSGALGTPCWCLTPSKPAWRYKVAGDMDWYGCVKLYRQEKDSWDAVFKQVDNDLCKLLQKNTES